MELPADGHVHSEWSWDAHDGSMERTCARAAGLGLRAVAFTEHVDHTSVAAPPGGLMEQYHGALVSDGTLTPPPLDVDGYLAGVERCRVRFPELRILTGMELGEPHRDPDRAAAVLRRGPFERVLGSLHSLPFEDGYAEPPELFRHAGPAEAADAMRAYLAELALLVAGSDAFHVLAHVDYAARYWPAAAGPYDPLAFEAEHRHVLALLAASGRPLELNTVRPLDGVVLGWWVDAGGERVTFGSDAHEPENLGHGLAEAAAQAGSHGFTPDRRPEHPWVRA